MCNLQTHTNVNIRLLHKHIIQHHRYYFPHLILIAYISLIFFALLRLPTHTYMHYTARTIR